MECSFVFFLNGREVRLVFDTAPTVPVEEVWRRIETLASRCTMQDSMQQELQRLANDRLPPTFGHPRVLVAPDRTALTCLPRAPAAVRNGEPTSPSPPPRLGRSEVREHESSGRRTSLERVRPVLEAKMHKGRPASVPCAPSRARPPLRAPPYENVANLLKRSVTFEDDSDQPVVAVDTRNGSSGREFVVAQALHGNRSVGSRRRSLDIERSHGVDELISDARLSSLGRRRSLDFDDVARSHMSAQYCQRSSAMGESTTEELARRSMSGACGDRYGENNLTPPSRRSSGNGVREGYAEKRSSVQTFERGSSLHLTDSRLTSLPNTSSNVSLDSEQSGTWQDAHHSGSYGGRQQSEGSVILHDGQMCRQSCRLGDCLESDVRRNQSTIVHANEAESLVDGFTCRSSCRVGDCLESRNQSTLVHASEAESLVDGFSCRTSCRVGDCLESDIFRQPSHPSDTVTFDASLSGRKSHGSLADLHLHTDTSVTARLTTPENPRISHGECLQTLNAEDYADLPSRKPNNRKSNPRGTLTSDYLGLSHTSPCGGRLTSLLSSLPEFSTVDYSTVSSKVLESPGNGSSRTGFVAGHPLSSVKHACQRRGDLFIRDDESTCSNSITLETPPSRGGFVAGHSLSSFRQTCPRIGDLFIRDDESVCSSRAALETPPSRGGFAAGHPLSRSKNSSQRIGDLLIRDDESVCSSTVAMETPPSRGRFVVGHPLSSVKHASQRVGNLLIRDDESLCSRGVALETPPSRGVFAGEHTFSSINYAKRRVHDLFIGDGKSECSNTLAQETPQSRGRFVVGHPLSSVQHASQRSGDMFICDDESVALETPASSECGGLASVGDEDCDHSTLIEYGTRSGDSFVCGDSLGAVIGNQPVSVLESHGRSSFSLHDCVEKRPSEFLDGPNGVCGVESCADAFAPRLSVQSETHEWSSAILPQKTSYMSHRPGSDESCGSARDHIDTSPSARGWPLHRDRAQSMGGPRRHQVEDHSLRHTVCGDTSAFDRVLPLRQYSLDERERIWDAHRRNAQQLRSIAETANEVTVSGSGAANSYPTAENDDASSVRGVPHAQTSCETDTRPSVTSRKASLRSGKRASDSFSAVEEGDEFACSASRTSERRFMRNTWQDGDGENHAQSGGDDSANVGGSGRSANSCLLPSTGGACIPLGRSSTLVLSQPWLQEINDDCSVHGESAYQTGATECWVDVDRGIPVSGEPQQAEPSANRSLFPSPSLRSYVRPAGIHANHTPGYQRKVQSCALPDSDSSSSVPIRPMTLPARLPQDGEVDSLQFNCTANGPFTHVFIDHPQVRGTWQCAGMDLLAHVQSATLSVSDVERAAQEAMQRPPTFLRVWAATEDGTAVNFICGSAKRTTMLPLFAAKIAAIMSPDSAPALASIQTAQDPEFSLGRTQAVARSITQQMSEHHERMQTWLTELKVDSVQDGCVPVSNLDGTRQFDAYSQGSASEQSAESVFRTTELYDASRTQDGSPTLAIEESDQFQVVFRGEQFGRSSGNRGNNHSICTGSVPGSPLSYVSEQESVGIAPTGCESICGSVYQPSIQWSAAGDQNSVAASTSCQSRRSAPRPKALPRSGSLRQGCGDSTKVSSYSGASLYPSEAEQRGDDGSCVDGHLESRCPSELGSECSRAESYHTGRLDSGRSSNSRRGESSLSSALKPARPDALPEPPSVRESHGNNSHRSALRSSRAPGEDPMSQRRATLPVAIDAQGSWPLTDVRASASSVFFNAPRVRSQSMSMSGSVIPDFHASLSSKSTPARPVTFPMAGELSARDNGDAGELTASARSLVTQSSVCSQSATFRSRSHTFQQDSPLRASASHLPSESQYSRRSSMPTSSRSLQSEDMESPSVSLSQLSPIMNQSIKSSPLARGASAVSGALCESARSASHASSPNAAGPVSRQSSMSSHPSPSGSCLKTSQSATGDSPSITPTVSRGSTSLSHRLPLRRTSTDTSEPSASAVTSQSATFRRRSASSRERSALSQGASISQVTSRNRTSAEVSFQTTSVSSSASSSASSTASSASSSSSSFHSGTSQSSSSSSRSSRMVSASELSTHEVSDSGIGVGRALSGQYYVQKAGQMVCEAADGWGDVDAMEQELRKGNFPENYWELVERCLKDDSVVRLLTALMERLHGEDNPPRPWWAPFPDLSMGILTHDECLAAKPAALPSNDCLAIQVFSHYILRVPRKQWSLPSNVTDSILQRFAVVLDSFETDPAETTLKEISGFMELFEELRPILPNIAPRMVDLTSREERRAALRKQRFWLGYIPVATLVTVCPNAPQEAWGDLATQCIEILKPALRHDDDIALRLTSQAVCSAVVGELFMNVGWCIMDFLEWRRDLQQHLLDTRFLRDVSRIQERDISPLKRKLKQLFERTYKGPDYDDFPRQLTNE